MSEFNEIAAGGSLLNGDSLNNGFFFENGSSGIFIAGTTSFFLDTPATNLSFNPFVELLPFQLISANDIVVSPLLDVSSLMTCSIQINYCKTENGTYPPVFRIESQHKDLERFWFPIHSWSPKHKSLSGSLISESVTVNSNEIVTEPLVAWKPKDLCLILHENDLFRSEFVRLLSIEEEKVTIQSPVILNHIIEDEDIYLLNNAELFNVQLNVSALSKIRVVVDAINCDFDFVTSISISET